MSQLAIDLRPQSLGEVIGNEPVKRALQHFIDKDEYPKAMLFFGPPGTGKTTLASIIAAKIQPDPGYVVEVNGSDKNGVDDARQMAEDSASIPFNGRPRVFIINEAHRTTTAAQDVLLEPIEKNPSRWIFPTTDPQKLLPALKSRCAAAAFELKPLTKSEIVILCEQALLAVNPDGTWQPQTDQAAEWLYENDVRQPREVLGAVERFFAGVPIDKCLNRSEHEPLYADVARAVVRGQWSAAAGLLEKIKTCDSRAMTSVVSAFLKSQILKEDIGPRADALAVCLCGLDSTGFADGTAYGNVVGLLYRCCKALGR